MRIVVIDYNGLSQWDKIRDREISETRGGGGDRGMAEIAFIT